MGKGRNPSKLIALQLDLGNLKTVDKFVEQFKKNGIVNKKLDFLINNAGVMAFPEFGTTADGIERQFGINHIGHFYLTNKLLPILRANKTRIINLSSLASRMVNSDQMNAFLSSKEAGGPSSKTVPYNQWVYYGISKLSNVLFTRQLNRLYAKNGIVALTLHPGGIMTGLAQHMKIDLMIAVVFLKSYMYMKTIPQGAATTMRCITIADSEIYGDKGDDDLAYWYNDCRTVKNVRFWAPTFNEKQLKEMDVALWDRSVKIIHSLDYLKLNGNESQKTYFATVHDDGIKIGGTVKVTVNIKRLNAMWIEAELGENDTKGMYLGCVGKVMELEEDDDTVQLRWQNYDECWIPIKACTVSNGAEPTLPNGMISHLG